MTFEPLNPPGTVTTNTANVPYAETPGGRADRKTLAIEALEREIEKVWPGDETWTEEQETAARLMRWAIKGCVSASLAHFYDISLTTAPSTRGASA